MKRLMLMLSILAVGTVVFTGCKKEGCTDEEATNYDPDAKTDDGTCEYPTNQLPQITDFKVNGASATSGDHANGDTVEVTFVASDNEGLLSYEITELISGSSSSILLDDGDLSGGSGDLTYTYIVALSATIGSTIEITSYVIDDDLDTASMTYTITVISAMTSHSGQFYHVEGTLKGAYDLVTDQEKSSTDTESDKDMRNIDLAGNPFTGNWDNGDSGASNTMYVLDNNFDYDAATPTSAETAYLAGTPSTGVTTPTVDDIYIADLRGNGDYAVIKITNLDPADNTCGCGNPGIIEFDYKK